MKRWFWLLIGALLIVSLSCSLLPGRNNDNNNTDEPAEVTVEVEPEAEDPGQENPPVDEPEDESPGDEVPAEDEALEVDADALEQLDSYRATLTWRTEKADGTVEEFSMEQSATRDPAAERFVMRSAEGDVEFIQIGNDTWMRFGEEWMQTTSEDESEFGDMLSSGDDWISDMSDEDYEFVGRETVNGINTRHYRVERNEGMLGLFESEGEVSDVDEGTADVWIADEPDLPQFAVKFEVYVKGTSEGEDIEISMTQEVLDVNEPLTIEAPEGVGGMPADLPMYPDATDVTSMGTLTMFTVTDDVATVNAFYVDALTAAGWTDNGEGMVTEEMVSTTWTKDGETLSLMISSGDDGTSVMISLEE